MKSNYVENISFTVVFLIIALAGTSNLASAQKRRDENQSRELPERSAAHQEQYDRQKVQNQQRYEQRRQNYQDFHRQRVDNGQITNVSKPRLPSSTEIQRNKMYTERKVDDRERQHVQSQIRNWNQSERSWQSQYNDRWQREQNQFDRQAQFLRGQNRLAQNAFEQAYWERVREDRDRLQGWQFYNDVALDYSYLRGGRYYYTSQYGMNLLTDAVNDGYQEGYLAGQADREDGARYDFNDAFAFQDASYGYNGYWVDLSEYQYYFRQGFQNGYDDGFYSRYRYGAFTNGNYVIGASVLHGLLNFSYIGR